MNKIDISVIYKTLRNWLEIKGEIESDTDIAEVCDFSDSYGFCFETKDRFSNVYWCVDKKTYTVWATRPNLIIEEFKQRKIIPNEEVLKE